MTTTQIGLIDIQEARQASQFFMRDGQVIELRALDATLHSDRLPYDKPRVIAGWFDNVDALVAALPQIASAGGIYITINPCQPALLARANNRLKDKKVTATTDEQIVTRQYLLIDADPERDGHVTGVPANDTEHQIALDFVQSICAELANEGWPDPLRFDSGNGGYALYAIDLPASDDGLVERVLKGLALRFNTAQVHIDLTSYNQSRIMRLPGTWNCKGDGTEDRPHRLSKIISIPDEIHPVAIDLLETIAVPIVQEQKPTSKKDRQPPDYLDEWNIAYGPQLPYNGGSKWQLTEGCPFCGNNDHNVFAYISPHGKLGFKCSHNSCTGLHWQELRLHFEPTAYDKQNNLVPYIPEPQQSSNGNGNGKTLPNPLQSNPVRNPDSQRSEIIINNAQLRDTTSAAMSALHSVPATNERLFVHFSQLSRVVKDEDDRPIVQQMNVASVKGELSEAADFYRVRKDQKEDEMVFTAVSPPNEIAEQILALPPSDWKCPSLKGVTEVPLVKPDGTLLDTPGYDKKLKVFYDPSEDLKDLEIPEECTQEDAIKAVEFLKHLIAEFPFEGEADIANMLGLLITPFIRHAFKGDIQLALLDATNPGTGKTFLAQIAAIIATGTRTEARSQKGDDDEWRKFILAVLLKCPQIVLIDNVRGTLAAVSLEAALTSETISDRLLGVSKDVSATNTALWIVTGNNLLIGGDLARRCFRIRLIATDANPDERDDYDIPDILDYCEEHRKELVVAILTMIKAWFQAGKPVPSVKISKADSFGNWIKMVGGILDFAGVQGWQQNREELRSKNNEEAKEWERFLTAWSECYGEKWKKTIDVQKDVINGSQYSSIEDEMSTMIFEAVPTLLAEKFIKNRDGFYLSLARALKFRKQTVFGLQGFQIESQEDSHTKNLMWRVTTKKSPEDDPENKSKKEPPQMVQSINKQTQSTSGFSDTDKTTAVVCGGSTPLLSGKNNIIFPDSAEREYTTATHTYSPEPQGFQTTANHRKAPNDTVGKAPSDQSTSGGNDVSEEAQKTPICGGSFKNSESDVDCQGLSEEHTSLFIDYAQMVRQHEKSVLMWQAPDSGFKNSPFGKEEHIKFTKSLLRSGEFDKIKAALEAMQRTLGEYGEGRKHG